MFSGEGGVKNDRLDCSLETVGLALVIKEGLICRGRGGVAHGIW
jgi:hypothetical protein